jgi:hypothetical protein
MFRNTERSKSVEDSLCNNPQNQVQGSIEATRLSKAAHPLNLNVYMFSPSLSFLRRPLQCRRNS